MTYRIIFLAILALLFTKVGVAEDTPGTPSADVQRSTPNTASAEQTPGNNKNSSTRSESTAALNQAQRVYIDPATGRLLQQPPPGVEVIELSPQEQQMLSRSDVGLHSEYLPDGTVIVNLQGRFRHFAVATVNKDGAVKTNCVGDQPILDHEHGVAGQHKRK